LRKNFGQLQAVRDVNLASRTFASIGRALPTAWAMEGFQDSAVRSTCSGAVLQAAGLLLAYAAVFFGWAVWRFHFE
jgi:ABC-type multidrug transport system permease subunit